MPQRALLRAAASLIVGGMILNQAVTAFHPAGEDPNDHPAVFAEYADSDVWEAVHFGQFAAALIIIAGFILLYRALLEPAGAAAILARLAVASAIATGAAVAVLQAIDGVTLKQAVDHWASASGAEKAIAFKDAETVRWMEWGANSYFRLLQGVTIALYGIVIARGRTLPAWLGWLALLAGLGYITTGIIVGYDGFSDAQQVVSTGSDVLLLAVAIGIAVVAWRVMAPAGRADTGR